MGLDLMEVIGLSLLGVSSVGIGSSVVLFKYNEKYRNSLKFNWYIIGQGAYIFFGVVSGVSIYLIPFASTAVFIPVQIIST